MRIEKKQIVNDIGAIIENSSFLYMVSYKGLKVKEFEQLRSDLSKVEAQCHILKNSLILKAAELKNVENLASMNLIGDTALVSGSGDPGMVAKSLSDFAKKHNLVSFKGGYLDGSVLTGVDVESIAKLPPKEILLAQLLGTLQAPAKSLASLLNAKLSTIVYVINSYKEKLSNS
jgi:large subunit ribosomal protein L10